MKAWSPYTEVFVACFNRDVFETLRRSLIIKMLFDTPNRIILFLSSIFYLLPISRLYNVQKSYIHRPCGDHGAASCLLIFSPALAAYYLERSLSS